MMSPPEFSIVVPAYNAARTISAALESIRRQTLADYEVIVVDDGSTDGTAEAAAPFAVDSRYAVLRQDNQGQAEARNTGIAASSGAHVVFLDADDLLLPDYLGEMQRLSRAHPASGLFFTDAWVFDDLRRRVGRRTAMESLDPPHHPLAAGDLFDALVERNFVFVAATVRRDALLSAGPFATVLGAEDWEMWLRLAGGGVTAVPAPRPLALYRRSQGQTSADPLRMLNAVHDVLDLVERTYELSSARRERVAQRRREIARLRTAAGGESPPGHRRLNSLRRLAGRWRHWRLRPPRAVREAFPDLKTL